MRDAKLNRRNFLKGAAAIGSAALLPGLRELTLGQATAHAADDLAFAPAWQAAEAIRAKEVSSVELTEAMLARIDRFNGDLNAIVTLTADQARAGKGSGCSARPR